MKTLDMNDVVWVKLSPRGLIHLTQWCRDVASHSNRSERSYVLLMEECTRPEGWFEFSLKQLMKTFSKIINDGYQIPFEGNVIYTEKPF